MKKLLLFSSLFLILSSFAYTSEDLSNANSLADQQIIMKQTIASKYGLDNKILRQEVIAMALKIKGITLPENYKCKKYFSDVTSSSDWVCRAIEVAADNGIITRGNKYANPGKYVTRAEALSMVMKAAGFTDELSQEQLTSLKYQRMHFDTNTSWHQDVILQAMFYNIIDSKKYIIDTGHIGSEGATGNSTMLEVKFYPNRLATRAEVFKFTKNIITSKNPSLGFDKTYSNDIFSFQYSSQYHNSQTDSVKNVSLKEEGNKIDIGSYSTSGDVIVSIKYYKNINSDSAILNTLGYSESEGCQGPIIANKRTLSSGAVTFTPQFGKVMELCGINGAWKGLYFPNEGVLISIFLGQDGQFEVLSTAKNVDYEEITRKFMETFRIVSQ